MQPLTQPTIWVYSLYIDRVSNKCTAILLNHTWKAFSCQCTLKQKEEGDEAFYRSGLAMTDSKCCTKLH